MPPRSGVAGRLGAMVGSKGMGMGKSGGAEVLPLTRRV